MRHLFSVSFIQHTYTLNQSSDVDAIPERGALPLYQVAYSCCTSCCTVENNRLPFGGKWQPACHSRLSECCAAYMHGVSSNLGSSKAWYWARCTQLSGGAAQFACRLLFQFFAQCGVSRHVWYLHTHGTCMMCVPRNCRLWLQACCAAELPPCVVFR